MGFNKEKRIVLRHYGLVNPTSTEDYMNKGGYEALKKAKAMQPMDVVEEVKKSNLRGRGGAGFPTGLKWSFTAKITGADQKYVVCNADEGEPGTYKDRLVMEGVPHQLIEGMAIAGHAIGATKGYIYCRGEYPNSQKALREAIANAKAKGILDGFDLEVRSGAFAYVCGEETALIESVEGHRGEPRYKPPYPGVAGLWGKPTIVNNVETYANIPAIIENGADWFAAIGSKNYPGTKVFTLSGDVVNKTFVEVPTDVTLREIIFDFGGGIVDGKRFKAVQVGGNSGGIIPEELLDTPIDFDAMVNIGMTLGTGAVFVMDETRDMVDVVKCMMKFFEHESCGKCTPCREGTFRLFRGMCKIANGEANANDLNTMETLARVMNKTALCGLGQAAPTPFQTSLRYFAADYQKRL